MEKVPRHRYSQGHMDLYLRLVICASVSLRGVGRILPIFLEFMGISEGCPSWFCGRLWLLRLGYYKLTRAKELASDWVWIIDHTIQIGSEKCFVVLGIRLSSLPPVGTCLRHEDVEPLAIYPVKQSNGEIVFEQLREVVKITGVPRQIVGDHGSDIAAGINKFRQEYQQTSVVYDIKHKGAAVLKRELEADELWQPFCQKCAQAARKVRQTSLAHLCPPNQRSKARYMNVDSLISWGSKILTYLEREVQEEGIDPAEVEEKFGWIRSYRDQLKGWGDLLGVVSQVESFVRKEGLYRGCNRKLKKQLEHQEKGDQTKRISSELQLFVLEESSKAKPGERLVGSSEVIESVFGKLKEMERNQSNSGFTGLILGIAAMVSKTTTEVIRKAMETVPTKKVLEWCTKKLGQSVQAKRKKAFAAHSKVEQKTDQLEAVS